MWHGLLHIDFSKVNFLIGQSLQLQYTPISNIPSESLMNACWSNQN